jgi:hypothetical protein
MQIKENPTIRTLIGPIELEDWQALLNIKAFIRDMQESNKDGQYFDRIRKYQSLYKDGIKYYKN